MSIINTISGYLNKVSNLGPLKKIGEIASSVLNKVTFGRGLKIWSKPGVKTVKAKNDFHEMELANGMKVIFKQSKGTEISADLTFDTGTSKDPKGKEGLAHFLEHIVVSNTKDFGDEIKDSVYFNGGSINAYTGPDETGYTLTLPKDKLDLALRIFRAYMSPLEFDDKVVEKEKGIIAAELKMFEANPHRKAYLALAEMLYGKGHLLTRDPGGNSEAVMSVNKADLNNFHQREYVPNNATLVISGEFKPSKLKTLLTRYFGDLKANPDTKAIDHSKTIKMQVGESKVLNDDSLESNVQYAFKTRTFNHKDTLIASLITQALTGGNDARLNKKLVDGEMNAGKGIANYVFAYNSADKHRGHYSISAKPLDENREANFKAIDAVIDEELQDIIQNGLTPKEFQRVVRRMENAEIYKKDFQHADLGSVSSYRDNGEDWSKVFDYLKDLKAITNEDIKAFAAKYFTKENRLSFKTVGKGKGFDGEFKNALNDKMPNQNLSSGKELGMTAEKLAKVKRLSGGVSNIEANISGVEKYQHANGMKVQIKEDHDLPITLIRANFPGGSLAVADKDELALGVASGILGSTGTYNPKTQRRMDKKTIENLKIQLGSSFHLGSSMDHGSIGIRSLSHNLDKTLALFNEYLNYPALLETENQEVVKEVEAEFEREKKQALDFIEMAEKFPAVEAGEKLSRAMYPEGHKLRARTIAEQKQDIKNLKLEDIRNLYKKLYFAQGANITAVGDLNRETIDTKVIPVLDNWNKEAHGTERKPDYSRIAAVEAPKASIQVVTSKMNQPESSVAIANPAEIQTDDKDYYPALLANMIFGSGMSSRLFNEVREEKGLVYHIGSGIQTFRKGCGPFGINYGCDPRKVKESLAATLQSIKTFLKDGVRAEELEVAKSDMKKSFAMGAFNSRSDTIGTLTGMQLRGKDEAFINNFNHMIDAISIEQVNAAARKMMKPENFTIVITKPKDFKMEKVDTQNVELARSKPDPQATKKQVNMSIAA